MTRPDLDPKANQLLAALPSGEWQRWLPQLERVEMPLGQVLYESGTTLSHVYFPTTSIVSLLYVMENGASAEIAVVGNEGIVGISLFMGGESTPSRAVVQSAGHGYRLKAEVIKDEFNRAPVLHLLLRYTQALITQMAQTAVCNRHHSLDQQLCRWLLLSLDRLRGNELVDDAGADRQHARRAPRRRDRGRRQAAEGGPDQVLAAAASRCSTGPAWRSAAASATPSSRRSTTGCCRPSRLNEAPMWGGRQSRWTAGRRLRAGYDRRLRQRRANGPGPLPGIDCLLRTT